MRSTIGFLLVCVSSIPDSRLQKGNDELEISNQPPSNWNLFSHHGFLLHGARAGSVLHDQN